MTFVKLYDPLHTLMQVNHVNFIRNFSYLNIMIVISFDLVYMLHIVINPVAQDFSYYVLRISFLLIDT